MKGSAALRDLGKLVRLTDVPNTGRFFGPDPEAHCPCGSRRRARNCHRATDDSWVASPPPPLIDGPRTNYANPQCYARSSTDCSKQITREHWLTAGVLDHIAADGRAVLVSGAAWLGAGSEATVGVNSLSSWVLCNRHNEALSPLDTLAGAFFQSFRDDCLDLVTHSSTTEFECCFTMMNGPMFQLWLLKVLWGALEAETFLVDGQVPYRFRLGVSKSTLAEILWRGAPWPRGWGLYVLTGGAEGPFVMNSVVLRAVNIGPEIVGGAIKIGGIDFCIAFEPVDVDAVYRPSGMNFQRAWFRNWKSFAFCWPELGHDPVTVNSALPPGADAFSPPMRPGMVPNLGQFRSDGNSMQRSGWTRVSRARPREPRQ